MIRSPSEPLGRPRYTDRLQSKDRKPSKEPAAGENVPSEPVNAPEDTNSNVKTSPRDGVDIPDGKYNTRYSLRQQRSILSSKTPVIDNQAQKRVTNLSGAKSRSPKAYLESNDGPSNNELVRDSDPEDTEFHAPVAIAGSAAMDERLNPAAAQFVVDSHASVMRQTDPHATMPSGEDAENCSHISRKLQFQKRSLLRPRASSRRRYQRCLQILDLSLRTDREF